MWSEGRGGRWPTRWPVAAAIALRLALWVIVPGSRFESDEASYYQAGITLLRTGQQDLFWPPLTGWLIAGAAWALHTASLPALRLVWIAMDIGCVVAVATLARRLASAVARDDGERADRIVLIATAAYAVYLPAMSFAQFTTSEVPALLQMLGVLVLLTRPRAGVKGMAAAGLLTGTLVLTRPSLMPLAMLLPAWLAWRANSTDRRQALVMVVAAGVVVGAAVGRNWLIAGEATIARNAAYNLYIGNQPVYAEDLDLFSPRATPEQIAFRRQFWNGTLQYPSDAPDALQRAALAWIVDHPLEFARRVLGRLARVFAPRTDVLELAGGERAAGVFSPVSLALLAAANAQWLWVLFGGLVGLVSVRRHSSALGSLVVAAIAGSLLLCLVAIAKPRYSFVFDPLLILGAATVTTAPRAVLAELTTGERWTLAGLSVFLLWGWAAWLIFAVTSRLALAA